MGRPAHSLLVVSISTLVVCVGVYVLADRVCQRLSVAPLHVISEHHGTAWMGSVTHPLVPSAVAALVAVVVLIYLVRYAVPHDWRMCALVGVIVIPVWILLTIRFYGLNPAFHEDVPKGGVSETARPNATIGFPKP